MHSFLLQDWVTINGDGTAGGGVSSVAQNSAEYLDLDGYQDVCVWWQVSSASGGTVGLDFQTAPEKDETNTGSGFKSLRSVAYTHGSTAIQALPATIGTSVNPQTASTPLARWVRWNVSCGAVAVWSITFRVFVSGITYQ